MMMANNVMIAQSAKPPHNGAVTHHHDQVITLHNFNVINTIASNPKNEIPPPDVVFLLLIIVIFKLLRRRQDSNLQAAFTTATLAVWWFYRFTHTSSCSAYGTRTRDLLRDRQAF